MLFNFTLIKFFFFLRRKVNEKNKTYREIKKDKEWKISYFKTNLTRLELLVVQREEAWLQ